MRRNFPSRWRGCAITTPMASEDCAVNYRETSTRLAEYRRQIAGLRDKMREARAAAEPEEVPDYVFTNSSGSMRLSQLFGDKPDLIVITTWAPPALTARCGPTASTASMIISR